MILARAAASPPASDGADQSTWESKRLRRPLHCCKLASVPVLRLRYLIPVCAALVLAAAGCALRRGEVGVHSMGGEIGPTVDWRSVATADDRRRLREWRTAWTTALAKAAAHRPELRREGALLEPDAALPNPLPPPGDYQCRTLKIGAKAAGMLDYVAYPAFNCRIRLENGIASFAKLGGSQRPIGLLFEENSRRLVFLGTLQLGDERRALQYGRDRERNMAGVLERIGDERWRLVLPYPNFESTLDVLELIPAKLKDRS